MGMAWFERNHVCVDFRFFDSDSAEQFGKSTPRFAAHSGKDPGKQLDQFLRRRRRRIEVPRAQVPFFENE